MKQNIENISEVNNNTGIVGNNIMIKHNSNKESGWLSRNFVSVFACVISFISLLFVYFRVDMTCDTEKFLPAIIAVVAVIVAFQALFQIYNSIHYQRDIARSKHAADDVTKLREEVNKIKNEMTALTDLIFELVDKKIKNDGK